MNTTNIPDDTDQPPWREEFDKHAETIFGDKLPNADVFSTKEIMRLDHLYQVALNTDCDEDNETVSITCTQKFVGCFEIPSFIYSVTFRQKHKTAEVAYEPNKAVKKIDHEWVQHNILSNRGSVIQDSLVAFVNVLVLSLEFRPEIYVEIPPEYKLLRFTKEDIVVDLAYSTTTLANTEAITVVEPPKEPANVSAFSFDDSEIGYIKTFLLPPGVTSQVVNFPLLPKVIQINQTQVEITSYGDVLGIDKILAHKTIVNLAALGVRRIKTVFYPSMQVTYTYLTPRSIMTDPKNS